MLFERKILFKLFSPVPDTGGMKIR